MIWVAAVAAGNPYGRQASVDMAGAAAEMLLAQQEREGDPTKQGVVWPRIAEIGLLVSLGGGGTLLRFALQRIKAEGFYQFVVCQATLASVGWVLFSAIHASCRAPRATVSSSSASSCAACAAVGAGRVVVVTTGLGFLRFGFVPKPFFAPTRDSAGRRAGATTSAELPTRSRHAR